MKLTNKYAIDFSYGQQAYRSDADGKSIAPPIFDCYFELIHGKNKDHSPRFAFYLEILGRVICDFAIYNMHHAE